MQTAGAAGATAGAAAGAGCGGVYGTGFHALPIDGAMEGDAGAILLRRLATLFDAHTPASIRREAHAREDGRVTAPLVEGMGMPGPRWRTSATFASFLQSAGLVARGGGRGAALGVARPDVDLIWLATCGKGGSMGLLDFIEACANVARRLWPEQKDAHPSQLLAALLDRCFAGA